MLLDFGVVFEAVVTDTKEDDGEVELFKIVKMGQTEQVVKVALWSPGNECVCEWVCVCVCITVCECVRVCM